MRAAVCPAYGPPESVRIEEFPAPVLAPGQVRVRVAAAAVNYPDVLVIANQYQMSVPAPFVPGSEFAGVVSEIAGDVTDVRVGDRVFGTTFVGAFAEEVVVSAEAIRTIPAGIEERLAAAFAVAHRTAYHVLRSVAALKGGDELIVLGAGGGVGLAAVQIGVALGASVTAVASSEERLEAAATYGAKRLIDHRSGNMRQALREALPDGGDVVVDPVGGNLAEPALRSLRWGGRFITVGYASGEIPKIPLNLVLLKGVQVLGFQFRDFVAHMPAEAERDEHELMELLASREVIPHIGATFTFEDTVAALQHVAAGRAIGKVTLEMPSAQSG